MPSDNLIDAVMDRITHGPLTSLLAASRTPRLRHCPSALVPHLNRLVGAPLTVPVNGQSWNVRLSALPQPAASSLADMLRWHIVWDDCAIEVDMSASAVGVLFAACGCAYPVADLPDDLLLAIGQTVLSDVSQLLLQSGGSGLALRGITPAITPATTAEMPIAIAWQAGPCDSGSQLHGMLYPDETALRRLAALPRQAPVPGSAADVWSALRLAASMELGYTLLPLKNIASLCVGDTIFIDVAWGERLGAALVLRIAEHWLMRARLNEDNTITATSGMLIMTNESATASDHDFDDTVQLSADGLDALPIRLSFDLGERTLSLAELGSIQMGYVFDLALPVSRAVTLRANGMRIGEGELVDIDGRIGVAITRINAPGGA